MIAVNRKLFTLKVPRACFVSLNPKNETEALEMVKKTVEANPLVVFMKGTVDRPQCGFSRTVVQILQQFPALTPFETVNVLSNEEIRGAVKKFSEWQTIPQVYVKGSFVGGCDILYEMYRNGSLKDLFEKEKLFKE